jgi:hypothetical protein
MISDRECITLHEQINNSHCRKTDHFSDYKVDYINSRVNDIDSRICKYLNCPRSELIDCFSGIELKRMRIQFCK